jgi:hypothetical protein
VALAAGIFLHQLGFHQAPEGPAPQRCWVGLISQISRQISRFEAFLGLLKRAQQGLSQLLAVLNQHRLLAAVATTARFSHLTNRQ